LQVLFKGAAISWADEAIAAKRRLTEEMTMKQKMMTSVAIAILGIAFSAGAALAADHWDGGDDLPVSPLACDAGPAAASAAKPYDGGQPTGAADKAGKAITIVDVPKLIGIGYFNATSKGIQDAAKELGNVKASTDGPTEAKIDEQIKFIDNYVTRGVDGILFAANDPVAIAPVLKKALSKGIHVVGYDANSSPEAREWFVNQAQFNGIAKAMVDSLAKEVGEDKSFAIVTSTFTTPNQARWIAEMSAYAAKCHPKLKWLETVEAQEDNVMSFNQATTLINKYGDKLSGLLGMTSVATPASAEAVTKANLCGKVAVVGLATPNAMKPYVNSGCVKSVVLWNPVDLGYAATYVMRAAVDGKLKPGATSVDAGKLGKLNIINGSEVLLGSPFIFDKSNVKDFDF
jgi:rhamnose transport system substrate-binding protein